MLDEFYQIRLNEAYELIQNDTDLALDIFNELLEVEPDNIEILNGKGSALMKLNNIQEAEECFDNSISIIDNSSAWINKGIISKNKKEYQNALNYYDKAIQLNPSLNNIVNILKNEIIDLIDDDLQNNFTSTANDYIQKGLDYKNENKLWDALDCFNKAICEDNACEHNVSLYIDEIKHLIYKEFSYNIPDFGQSHIDSLKIKSLRALLIEENTEKALEFFNLILEIDEKDLDTLNYKGSVMFLFDDCDRALECFDKCLKIDGNYYHALFNKALVLRMMNRLDEALDCFNKLSKIPKYMEKVKLYRMEIFEKITASN